MKNKKKVPGWSAKMPEGVVETGSGKHVAVEKHQPGRGIGGLWKELWQGRNHACTDFLPL